jgi:RND family efflux transporter MFP subunit
MNSANPPQSSTRACVLIAIASAVALAGCSKSPPAEEPIRPVRTEQVFLTGGERVRTFSGTARAGVESRLSFRVAGTVQRVAVKVGDVVRRGQLLAELDPRDYELQVEGAEASLAQARARARNAESNLDRVRGLYENNNASQNDYDAARAEYEYSAAQVSSVEKQLELARSQLSYARLTSPLNGAISAVELEVNENVTVGQTAVVLTSGSRPEVQVAMPEVFIAQVREGEAVEVTFDALPGETFTATITEVGVAAGGLATTFPVTVSLSEASPEILPGMAAEVAIVFEALGGQDRIAIPPFAVGEDRQGRFVFIAEPGTDGLATARRRVVKVGDLTGGGLEILEGLEEGELLITAGVSRIEDGMQVRLLRTNDDGEPAP